MKIKRTIRIEYRDYVIPGSISADELIDGISFLLEIGAAAGGIELITVYRPETFEEMPQPISDDSF